MARVRTARETQLFGRLPLRPTEEGGYTLAEILVVVLIIGVLAAIAIPLFLDQKTKANDASAKVQARTAEAAAEAYSSDHGGEYTSISVPELQKIEPTLKDESAATLLKAEAKEDGYLVASEGVPTKNTFTIERTNAGGVVRTCSTEKTGSCPAGGSW